jgi:hypothetical protein
VGHISGSGFLFAYYTVGGVMNIITLIIPYFCHLSLVLTLQSSLLLPQDWKQHMDKPFSINSSRCDREVIIEAEDGTKAQIIIPNGMTVSMHGDEAEGITSRIFKNNIEVRILDIKPEHTKSSRAARAIMSHSQILIKVEKGTVQLRIPEEQEEDN